MRRLVALVMALFSLALVGPAVALAQEPTSPAAGFPITPDPAECQVEPRDLEAFVAISAAATPAGEMAEPTTVAVPVGPPADDATGAAITDTVREVFACFNAGDVRRALSLLTDDAIRDLAGADPIPEEELRAFLGATPEAVPAEGRATILAISDIVLLPEGQVGALVVTVDPTNPEENLTTVHFRFVQAEGRWLIDQVVEFHTHAEEGSEATPEA